MRVLPLLLTALIQSSTLSTRGPNAALRSLSDRGETRLRQEQIAQALTILVAGPLIASSRAFLSSSSVVEGRQVAPES